MVLCLRCKWFNLMMELSEVCAFVCFHRQTHTIAHDTRFQIMFDKLFKSCNLTNYKRNISWLSVAEKKSHVTSTFQFWIWKINLHRIQYSGMNRSCNERSAFLNWSHGDVYHQLRSYILLRRLRCWDIEHVFCPDSFFQILFAAPNLTIVHFCFEGKISEQRNKDGNPLL